MRSISDVLAQMRGMDAQEVFEALCKVDDAREVPREQVVERDEFPDFSDLTPAAPAGAPSAGPDAVVQALLQTLGEYRSLLARYNRDFDDVFAKRARGERESDDETVRRLNAAREILVKYPVAAQAAFAALVREGRRFAETDEGRAWKKQLAGSPVLAKARTLFEGLAGGIAAENQNALPSAFVDAFVRALDRSVEDVLGDVAGVGEER